MTSPEFELAMTRTEYDNAIKSLAVASKLAARYQGERDEALATIERVKEVVTGWRATDRVRISDLRAALEPTKPKKGEPNEIHASS